MITSPSIEKRDRYKQQQDEAKYLRLPAKRMWLLVWGNISTQKFHSYHMNDKKMSIYRKQYMHL